MVGGQIIHFGILHFMGVSMALYHFLGRYLRKCPPAILLAASAVLYGLTGWWTSVTTVSVGWLYPLGLLAPGFHSADYFPLLPWFFLFLAGTVLGGWCLDHRDSRVLTLTLPGALTWPGRHSLLIYLLHQPILFGVSYLIWG